MKRFMVFAWDRYYPLGGLSDLVGSFETKEEALLVAQNYIRSHDYVEVADFEIGSCVWASEGAENDAD